MKFRMSKKWCKQAVDLEKGHVVAAGRPVRRNLTLHVVVYRFAGGRNPYSAEVFTSKAKANRWMNGNQYGVIAERYQVAIPRMKS